MINLQETLSGLVCTQTNQEASLRTAWIYQPSMKTTHKSCVTILSPAQSTQLDFCYRNYTRDNDHQLRQPSHQVHGTTIGDLITRETVT